MSDRAGASEVWQARVPREFAAELRIDAEVLGLDGRTEIVKEALRMLHRRAAEERLGRSIDEFYGGATPPLPLGVLPDDADEYDLEGDDENGGARGAA